MTPLVYTVEEAGELLAISRGAAYAGVRAGEIPAVRIGRSLRIPRAALDAMLGLYNDVAPAGNGRFAPVQATQDGS